MSNVDRDDDELNNQKSTGKEREEKDDESGGNGDDDELDKQSSLGEKERSVNDEIATDPKVDGQALVKTVISRGDRGLETEKSGGRVNKWMMFDKAVEVKD